MFYPNSRLNQSGLTSRSLTRRYISRRPPQASTPVREDRLGTATPWRIVPMDDVMRKEASRRILT